MKNKEAYLQDLKQTKNLYQMVRTNSEYIIKLLNEVKTLYYYSGELDRRTNVVSLDDTNIDIDNPLGLLLDTTGLLFSIDGINETNALITFRSSLMPLDYVTEEEFEELVKATPTSCRLVNEDGVIQLQLENDYGIIDIDDYVPKVLLSGFKDPNIKDIFIIDFDFNDIYGTQLKAQGFFTSTTIIKTPITSFQQFFRELDGMGLCGLVIVDGIPYSSMSVINDKIIVGEYEFDEQSIQDTYNMFEISPFVSHHKVSL